MVFQNFHNRSTIYFIPGKRGKEGEGDLKTLCNIFWTKQKIQYQFVYLFKYTDLVHSIRMWF